MHFLPPFVLFGSLKAIDDDRIAPHAAAYQRYLTALRDGSIAQEAGPQDVWTAETLMQEA